MPVVDEKETGRIDEGEPLFVVGIGASAGGLEALRALLPQLPTNAEIAYVIVQHQSSKHKSLLCEISKIY